MRIKINVNIELLDGPFGRQQLNLSELLSELDLDEILPLDPTFYSFGEMRAYEQRTERRRRWTDSISSALAQAITEGLFKAVK